MSWSCMLFRNEDLDAREWEMCKHELVKRMIITQSK